MDLLRAQRGMLKQAFAQVGEVSVRMSGRSHTLVDLIYMHTGPRDVFLRQRSQHDPRSVTATDSQSKAATGSNRSTSIHRDCRRGRTRNGIGIFKYLELHEAFSKRTSRNLSLKSFAPLDWRPYLHELPSKIPSLGGGEGLRSLHRSAGVGVFPNPNPTPPDGAARRRSSPTLSAGLSANTEILLVRSGRVVPAPSRRNSLVDFTGTPRTFFVFVDGSAGLQHGIDNAPCFFHVVLTGKQGGVSRHCVAQHAFVRFHLLWSGMAAGHHLHILCFHPSARSHDSRAYGYRHLGTDPEPEMVPR